MSTIMSSFDAQNKAVREKMMCVNEFIRAGKLPKELAKRVRDFFEYVVYLLPFSLFIYMSYSHIH